MIREVAEVEGLEFISLNAPPGDLSSGDFGIAALPERWDETRDGLLEAIAYAKAAGAGFIHVLPGKASGPRAHAAFVRALAFACDRAEPLGLKVLIEPINGHDVPGYFLQSCEQAREIIEEVNRPVLRLMFDSYHMGRIGVDVIDALSRSIDLIGHIQFASVPDRGPPQIGSSQFARLFEAIEDLGWSTPIGAEYRPPGETDDTLEWLRAYQQTQA